MENLTIQQKAERYDKALEKARQLCVYPTSKPFISDLQDLFPELNESEDELDALYNAILHVPLPYRRELYSLKTQIEDESKR